MAWETIRAEVENRVMTLTLNRPDRMNAFTVLMRDELIEAFDKADADDAVRAIIVTGEGRAFCAGADLSGEQAFNASKLAPDTKDPAAWANPILRDGGGKVALRIFRSLKPVIAAVNGAAVGVGATMQLPMDVRLCSEKARFGFVFGRRGITPEACSSWFLPRVVGISRALEWTMSGRIFGADEALAGGLVRSVHAPEDLMPAAMEIARGFADEIAPVSVALTRQMMWRMLGAPDPMHAHRIDSRAVAARAASADAEEGIASFLEKRPAEFRMKVSEDMPGFFPWWEEEPWK